VPPDSAARADLKGEYILIGGLAVQAHGHVRTTQDVNILPDPEPSNLERLATALRALDARGGGADSSQFALSAQAIAAAGTLSLDTRAGGLDIHLRPPGAKPYEQLRARTLDLEVAGELVAIAGLDDLIAMKRAAGRPLDRSDVLALTEGEAAEDEPGD